MIQDLDITEKKRIYEQAENLSSQPSEESLEEALALYKSISGWQDADEKYHKCSIQLARLRWHEESSKLKEYENRNETKHSRLKKIGASILVVFLVCESIITTVVLFKLSQYNKAVACYTAGEYERAAEAFIEMADYKDSRSRVYACAVGLYKARDYEKALKYFHWLDGYMDNSYYIKKCNERLKAQGITPQSP